MRAIPVWYFSNDEALLERARALSRQMIRNHAGAQPKRNADGAAEGGCDIAVNEEGTQRGKPTPPRHHQCDECKGWHAGSNRWNWTADSRWLCQSCWQRHQGLQHQELQHQALEQAVQMPVPDDDPMDVSE